MMTPITATPFVNLRYHVAGLPYNSAALAPRHPSSAVDLSGKSCSGLQRNSDGKHLVPRCLYATTIKICFLKHKKHIFIQR